VKRAVVGVALALIAALVALAGCGGDDEGGGGAEA
jgi:predicted small lipoprotein YifL